MWMIRVDAVGARQRGGDPVAGPSTLADSPSSRLLVSMAEDDRDRDQQQADQGGADDVEVEVAR